MEEDVVDNIIGGVDFSMTVLRYKDVKKKEGFIDVYYMHSPFGYDDESIEPNNIGPFSKEVSLSYSGNKQGLPNLSSLLGRRTTCTNNT